MTVATPIGGPVSRIDRLSRRSRRIIAVATLLGLPAMYAWSAAMATTTIPSIVWGPVTFLLIGTTLVGSLVLYRFIRHRADMPGTGLDERERQLRDQAWILSYQILAAVVVGAIAIAAIWVLGFGRTIVLDAELVGALAVSIGVLLPILPVAALATIEPDPPAEA
jgi:hypothetical protein